MNGVTCIGGMVGSVTIENEEIEMFEEGLELQFEGENVAKG